MTMVVKTTILFHIDSKIYRKRDYMKKPAAIFFALVLAVIMCGAAQNIIFLPPHAPLPPRAPNAAKLTALPLGITSAKLHAQKPASAADAAPRRAARSVINGSRRTANADDLLPLRRDGRQSSSVTVGRTPPARRRRPAPSAAKQTGNPLGTR